MTAGSIIYHCNVYIMIQQWVSTVKGHQFPPLNSDTITIWLKDCWQWCYKLKQKNWWTGEYSMYSWNSVAQTALGPWKFAQDMIYSCHWGLIIVPGQEANGDSLRKSFPSSTQWWYGVYSLELPHTTYNTMMKQKHFPKCLFSQAIRRILWWLKKEFELAKVNEPSELSYWSLTAVCFCFSMSRGHHTCRKEFSSLDMNCFLNGVAANVKRKQPAWVAQLDAHPTGD